MTYGTIGTLLDEIRKEAALEYNLLKYAATNEEIDKWTNSLFNTDESVAGFNSKSKEQQANILARRAKMVAAFKKGTADGSIDVRPYKEGDSAIAVRRIKKKEAALADYIRLTKEADVEYDMAQLLAARKLDR